MRNKFKNYTALRDKCLALCVIHYEAPCITLSAGNGDFMRL